MVGDGRPVPSPRVPAAVQPHLLGGPGRRAQQPQTTEIPEDVQPFSPRYAHVRVRQTGQRGVKVAYDLEVAGDVGPAEAEVSGR